MEQEISKYPVRKNNRAKFHDYSGGEYFVTICTEEKEHFFGKIVGAHDSCARTPQCDNVMVYTEIGKYYHDQLDRIHQHYPYADVPLFAVMPNHVHAIIIIDNGGCTSRAPLHTPQQRSVLSVVIGGFKRAVTMYARRNNIDFEWQRGYHDHIIRNQEEKNKIADYIDNNVALWGADCFNVK